jgi:hypothetical protein
MLHCRAQNNQKLFNNYVIDQIRFIFFNLAFRAVLDSNFQTRSTKKFIGYYSLSFLALIIKILFLSKLVENREKRFIWVTVYNFLSRNSGMIHIKLFLSSNYLNLILAFK